MIQKIKINCSHYSAVREYIEAAKATGGFTLSGALGQLLLRAVQHDLLNIGGRWSADKSERRAARRAERAERQERKAAEPKPKEQPKDDEWTHSEWMAELRRLYMAKADTLEGDEQKAFCEASLPRFKVEDDARKFLAELKAEAEADDW